MDANQGRRLMTLLAVDSFMDAHADKLSNAARTGVRQRLGQTLEELSRHVQTQAASPLIAQGLTRAKYEKRDALLRDHMAPIARIARLSAAAVPELKPLKMPRGAPGMQKLLAHAEGMAVIAQQHRAVFTDAGLRPSFVEDLRNAIEDIQRTLAHRTTRYGDQAGASEGLQRALAAANRYKAVLDSFIQTEAQGNVELLADWKIIKRVPHPPGRRGKKAVPAAATGTAAAPAAPPATQATPIADPARLLSDGARSDVEQTPAQNTAPLMAAHEQTMTTF